MLIESVNTTPGTISPIFEERELIIPAGEVIGPEKLRSLADHGWTITKMRSLVNGNSCIEISRSGQREQLAEPTPLSTARLAELAADGWDQGRPYGAMMLFERPVAQATPAA